MPYDVKLKGPDIRNKVIINEAFTIKYWTDLFGCSEADLKKAVNAIGTSVDEVKIYLRAK